MAIELRQQLRLAQQLIMTPQLQQAIKLLQLSRLELLDTITQELEQNPLLEETAEGAADQQESQEEEEGESFSREKEQVSEVTIDEKPRDDFDWEAYLGEYSTYSSGRVPIEHEVSPELPSLEGRLTKKPDLNAHLLWQLHLSRLSDDEKEVGTLIIGNIDMDGYLKATVAEIAEMAGRDEGFGGGPRRGAWL